MYKELFLVDVEEISVDVEERPLGSTSEDPIIQPKYPNRLNSGSQVILEWPENMAYEKPTWWESYNARRT